MASQPLVFPSSLGLLGGDEVQTLVKFVNLPSPHPGSFLKAPMPLPWGEGGRRPGEGSVADRAALLCGLRLLAINRSLDPAGSYFGACSGKLLVSHDSGNSGN